MIDTSDLRINDVIKCPDGDEGERVVINIDHAFEMVKLDCSSTMIHFRNAFCNQCYIHIASRNQAKIKEALGL